MTQKSRVSETPATQMLRANGVSFSEHRYEYVDRGGAQHGPVQCALAE